MQRPGRIVVFGVFCLVCAGVTGAVSLPQAIVSLVGPRVLEQSMGMMESMGQGLSDAQRQEMQVQVRALSKPVYRVGQLVESSATSAMSCVLLIAGIGLLAGRSWSLKLTKWWSYYAIPAAAVSVVLTTRYLFPEMPDATTGRGVFLAAMMLLALWAFPIMLLRHLPSPEVKAYLARRDRQRRGYAAEPAPNAATTAPAPASAAPAMQRSERPPKPNSEQSPASRTSAPPEDPAAPVDPPTGTTWRDDPWNDPSSK